jgi:hypothetical protein
MSSYTSHTIIRNGITGFSDWAVGRDVGPTAVVLRSLAVRSPQALPVVVGIGLVLLAGLWLLVRPGPPGEIVAREEEAA